MPRGNCYLSFVFDLIWLENEELQDSERQWFSKWQQRQWLVTWQEEEEFILQKIFFQMQNFFYLI